VAPAYLTYTLSLHDALPIFWFLLLLATTLAARAQPAASARFAGLPLEQNGGTWPTSHVQGIAVDLQGGFIYYSFTTLLAKYDFKDRKSTRLNSSHVKISYAV